MKSKLLNPGPERTYAVVLEAGDEVMEALQRFAVQESLNASRISAIGAFERAELGYFELERKDYLRIPVEAQVEVLSLAGDVALDGGKPKLHLHAVLGRRDGSTVGGHLLSGLVRPTLEVLVTESPGYLRKTWDARFGLALIDPAA